MRTFRVALATRISFTVVAAIMYGFVVLIAAIPAIAGPIPADRTADAIVDVTAAVMLGFAVFMTFAVVASVRIRASVDATRLAALIVDGHDAFFAPHFRSIDVALAEIASVETRTEIVRSFGFTTSRGALSIVTRGGERIGLLSDTFGSASTLPLDDLANAIATGAGVTVIDDGTVRSRAFGLYGAESSSWTETPLDPVAAGNARRAVIRTAQLASLAVTLTFIVRAIFSLF